MREKIHSYLGFAKKSGNLVSGYRSSANMTKRKEVYLLILTEDLSENTKERFRRLAEKERVEMRIYGTVEKMREMTGEVHRGIYGITEKNLAKAILREIDR